MQAPNAFTSQTDLLRQLAEKIIRIFEKDEKKENISPPATLSEFYNLLKQCNQRLASKKERLLIAIDEYENIDWKIGERVFDEDLLATLRESIQSHRRLIWAFVGSHAVDELKNAPWSSYLISIRTIEIPQFSLEETRCLLTEPMRHSDQWDPNDPKRPGFSPNFWGEKNITRIFKASGGWPHLVQLLAETAIDLCNDESREKITPDILDRVMAKAVVAGDTVLRQLLKGESDKAEWDYIRGFIRQTIQPPPKDDTIYQKLRHRQIIAQTANGDWYLRVPLMQHWLQKRG
jgi:hypothetical protein